MLFSSTHRGVHAANVSSSIISGRMSTCTGRILGEIGKKKDPSEIKQVLRRTYRMCCEALCLRCRGAVVIPRITIYIFRLPSIALEECCYGCGRAYEIQHARGHVTMEYMSHRCGLCVSAVRQEQVPARCCRMNTLLRVTLHYRRQEQGPPSTRVPGQHMTPLPVERA